MDIWANVVLLGQFRRCLVETIAWQELLVHRDLPGRDASLRGPLNGRKRMLAKGGKVPTVELYDPQSDPDEMENLAAEALYQDQLNRLLGALRDGVESTNDPAADP